MPDAEYTIRAPEAGLYIGSYGDVGDTVPFIPRAFDRGNVRYCITSSCELANCIEDIDYLSSC